MDSDDDDDESVETDASGWDDDDNDSSSSSESSSSSSSLESSSSESSSSSSSLESSSSESSPSDSSSSSDGDRAQERRAAGVREGANVIRTRSFRQAAQVLQANRGRALSCLVVSAPTRPGTVAGRVAAFARFVLALENAECNLRSIAIEYLDWHGLPDDDLDRLFGHVLPAHRTLGAVRFEDSEAVGWHLPAQWVERLASSIPGNSPLTSLKWEGGSLNPAAARAIADMIRRDPPHLAHLVATPSRDGGLDRDSLKAIGDAVLGNKHLRRLHVRAKEVFADSLDGAVGPRSSLTHLYVVSTEPYTRGGVAGLADRLKTNTTMTDLQLSRRANGRAGPSSYIDERGVARCLLDALDTCNFTLTTISVTDPRGDAYEDAALAAFLARNRRIQRVLNELELTGEDYRLEPAGLWPHAMEVTSRVPTLLYSLLRRGAEKDVAHANLGVNRREGATAAATATASTPVQASGPAPVRRVPAHANRGVHRSEGATATASHVRRVPTRANRGVNRSEGCTATANFPLQAPVSVSMRRAPAHASGAQPPGEYPPGDLAGMPHPHGHQQQRNGEGRGLEPPGEYRLATATASSRSVRSVSRGARLGAIHRG